MRMPAFKQTQEVAGGRLASSAQPPRATSIFPHRLSPGFTPQPFPMDLANGTTSALQEGLRCFTAFRPLPIDFQGPMALGFSIAARVLK